MNLVKIASYTYNNTSPSSYSEKGVEKWE